MFYINSFNNCFYNPVCIRNIIKIFEGIDLKNSNIEPQEKKIIFILDQTITGKQKRIDEAYVDTSNGLPPIYWQGCLWGGKVPEVCAMIDELEARVNRDLDNNIVALWHDETQINRYFLERTQDVHTFGPEFAFPEVFEAQCNFSPKIVHLAKDNSKYHR